MIAGDRRTGRDSWLGAFRRRGRNERGQVLPIVAIMMFVFIALLALVIDLGSYDQAQRQTQATADAAALAGSFDLPASTSQAIADARKYVTSNFPGVPTTQPCTAGQPGTCITFPTATPADSQIKVVVTANTPTFFGKFLGLTNEAVGASAVASVKTTSTACTTTGTGCYAIWAADTTCSSNTGIFFNGGGYTIQGGIHSNGSFTATGGGSTFGGPVTYGTGTGCLNTTATLPSGSGPQAAIAAFPIDYTTDFPACGGTGTACNATGTPDYCSASAASFTFTGSSPPLSGYIYCAYGSGTGVTKSTPTTWNGTITFSGGAIGSSSSPVVASYIAGNVITGSGGEFFATCGYVSTSLAYTASTCRGASGQTMPAPATVNYPLIYATDSTTNVPSGDTYAVNLGGGGNNWQGDIFAPIGQVVVAAGSQTTGFIEAWDVGFSSGGIFNGDGSLDSGTTTSTGPAESLVQ
jgi:Flp pilus assembly protein TadG